MNRSSRCSPPPATTPGGPASPLLLVLGLLLLATAGIGMLACDSGNPVAPTTASGEDTETGTETDTSNLTIHVMASPTELSILSQATSTITVTATPTPADGTTGTLTTSLGNFGEDTKGDELQSLDLVLKGGSAQATLNPGSTTGTAVLLAAVGTSSGRQTVAIIDPGEPPAAAFGTQINGLAVIFSDRSSNAPTAWTWNFGDGDSSTAQNPSHQYDDSGTYTVNLVVSNGAGSSSTSQFVTVSAGASPSASFSWQIDGLQAIFRDTSSGDPTSWSWSFGDPDSGSNTSTTQNPSHTFSAPGTYTVTLEVANAVGRDSVQNLVSTGNAPAANFSFDATNLAVNFTDESTNNPTSWSWDFGDGSGTSTEKNPTYTYAEGGTYSVRLTATNDAGSSTVTKTVTVTPPTPPSASFTATVDAETLTVTFQDTSTGNPVSWSWDFGDGTSSSQRNPTRIYAEPGRYTVTLTVTDSAGLSDTASQQVVVGETPVARFSFTYSELSSDGNRQRVCFFDSSEGDPTSWRWSFGDGSSSTRQNPTKIYAVPTPGSSVFGVTLTATNPVGSDATSENVTVPGAPGGGVSGSPVTCAAPP